jgi:flagellar assembly protein FliH
MSTSESSRHPGGPIAVFQFQSFAADPQPAPAADFQLQSFEGVTREQPSFLGLDLHNQAQAILTAAQMRAQDLERQAYEEGFLQGQKDGQEIGKKSLNHVMQRFLEMLNSLETAKEELHRSREQTLVRLVLVMGEKLVGRELRLHPESIRHVIEQGLQHLAETEHLRLLLNPQDLEMLQQTDRSSWPSGIELVPEATITVGGFLLESPRGDLDGTRENRWVRVARVLEEVLEKIDADLPTP